MVNNLAEDELVSAFFPVLGILAGTLVGLVVFVVLHQTHDWNSSTPLPVGFQLLEESSIQFHSMLFSVIGWSFGLVIGQNRQLFGGGCFEIENLAQRRKALSVIALSFFVFVIATAILFSHSYVGFILFWLLFIFTALIYYGEMRYGRCFYMFH
jgi:hypothetical protein